MDAKLIVIGGSAGGFAAFSRILGELPADFSVPIVLVLHQPARSDSRLAETFGGFGPLPVKEAEDKEVIQAGFVYVAPPDYHLLIERDRSFSLSVEEPVQYSRPSIDVTFESAALACGEGLIGIILTGANSDGAQGLRAVAESGGLTVIQDPRTSAHGAMPTAASELARPDGVLPLESLAVWLANSGWKGIKAGIPWNP